MSRSAAMHQAVGSSVRVPVMMLMLVTACDGLESLILGCSCCERTVQTNGQNHFWSRMHIMTS